MATTFMTIVMLTVWLVYVNLPALGDLSLLCRNQARCRCRDGTCHKGIPLGFRVVMTIDPKASSTIGCLCWFIDCNEGGNSKSGASGRGLFSIVKLMSARERDSPAAVCACV
ncbi:hypothetical protein PoB_007370400 [Plakobranchus ocellatus]|uniref:Uncharacterized protein n=1 Tax=Plakobranchus ocellatus TaxID=259542 RepID=A0AAV4DSH4_9GAST|nr:hypothetical protein PoB_007370400 [Plakobranchus ocellatus]